MHSTIHMMGENACRKKRLMLNLQKHKHKAALSILVVYLYLFAFLCSLVCFIQQNTKKRIRCCVGMCAVRLVHNISQTFFSSLCIKFRLFLLFIQRITEHFAGCYCCCLPSFVFFLQRRKCFSSGDESRTH